MDNLMVAKLAGVAFLFIVFVVTVILMPRIFGVNPPSEAAGPPEAPTATAPAAPAASPSERPGSVSASARGTTGAAAPRP